MLSGETSGAQALGRLGHSFRDFRGDFAGLREAAVGLLRVDQLAVEDDFEDSVFAFDQGRVDVELFCKLFRQTDGLGLVVSNNAVFDLQGGHICVLRVCCGNCGERQRLDTAARL